MCVIISPDKHIESAKFFAPHLGHWGKERAMYFLTIVGSCGDGENMPLLEYAQVFLGSTKAEVLRKVRRTCGMAPLSLTGEWDEIPPGLYSEANLVEAWNKIRLIDGDSFIVATKK